MSREKLGGLLDPRNERQRGDSESNFAASRTRRGQVPSNGGNVLKGKKESASTGQGRGARDSQTTGRDPQVKNIRSRGDRPAQYHVQRATAKPLLARLDGVYKASRGWRAKCPSCKGKDARVSILELDGFISVTCFGGCHRDDVLAAAGVRWRDITPPRTWPLSPAERRQHGRAQRESGWEAALKVLAYEAFVVLVAARELYAVGGLSIEDGRRLAKSVDVIKKAAVVLVRSDR